MSTAINAKNILYIITKSDFGGAQRYVLELAIAQKAAGHNVTVACGPGGTLLEHLESAEINTILLPHAKRDIKLMAEMKTFIALWCLLRAVKPDIVHLNSSKIGGLGSLAARLQQVPLIVFTAHGWPFQEKRVRAWRMIAWLGSYLTGLFVHQVIVVSDNDAQLTPGIGLRHKTSRIYPALAAYPLTPRAEARLQLFSLDFIRAHEHQLWLVTHGELNHNKNHTTAIDAVAEYNSTHGTKLLYIIVGAGDTEATLMEQVELRSLRDYVYFLPARPDIRELLLAFDIYLIPSLKEGLPYALLEAGYAGLPTIASRVGGIPEIIRDGETGRLIDPQDHLSMAKALEWVINEPATRAAMSTRLKAEITTHFTLPTMIRATEEVYFSSNTSRAA